MGGGGTLNDQPFVMRGGLEPPTKGIHVLYPLTHQSSIPTELPHHKCKLIKVQLARPFPTLEIGIDKLKTNLVLSEE